ncbi:MAG: response regulator transcription factor [Planctomycetota bacterium]|nr:response regulator transcription factor [Planctomycetota bacterium]
MGPISILCVDDNPEMCAALQSLLQSDQRFTWLGHRENADGLINTVRRLQPAIVLLDIDMPGKDAIEALTEIALNCPRTRTIVFSGHARRDLIERAVEAGAWGFISKNDGDGQLIQAVERILEGEFVFSPEASLVLRGR